MNEGRKNFGLIQFVLLICLVNTGICHYFPQDVNNDTEGHLQHYRSRRNSEQDEQVCDVLGKVETFGSVMSIIPVIGPIFDTAVTVTKFGLSSTFIGTDCSELSLDTIKKEMNQRFDKLDGKVDRNYVAIQQLKSDIFRLHDKVDQLSKEVAESFKGLRIEPIVSSIKLVIEGFSFHQSRMNEYFNETNLNAIIDVLDTLKKIVEPTGGLISTPVNSILNQNFAIPEDGDDELRILALHALYYGLQTYASILLFVFENHQRLSQYYYDNGDFVNYNEELNEMKVIFNNFDRLKSKNILDNKVFHYDLQTTLAQNITLIDRFFNTIRLAERKIILQRRDSDKALIDFIHEKTEPVKKTVKEISEMVLPFMSDKPASLIIKIKNQSGKLRIHDWSFGDINDVKVKYATQYKNNGLYSRVSDWSEEYALGEERYALIHLPPVHAGITRLIFRKFSTEKLPQLVGIIENSEETQFKDIHRDLYNSAWAGEGSKDIALALINNGAEINAIFEKGRRPLHAAAEANNIHIANILIGKGVNINIQDDNGYTRMHLAAQFGNNEFCQYLINNGADANKQTYIEGLTALHLAVLHKQKSTVEFLMKCRYINFNLPDKNGNTPLHYAVTSKVESIVTALLSNNKINANAISNNKMSPLHQAVLDRSVPIVKLLLDKPGVDIDVAGPQGLRPIHIAVMVGSVELVKLLVSKNASLNLQSNTGWTPLHLAILLKNLYIIDFFLDPLKNIDVNLATADGFTALHMAALGPDINRFASLLVKNGADLNAQTEDGFTPLHIAAIHNKTNVAYILMRARANMTIKTGKGKVFLEFAVEKGNLDMVKSGFPTELVQEDQNHILNIAIQYGQLDVLKYLIEEKELTYTKENKNDQKLLLDFATSHGHLDILKYLIEERKLTYSDHENQINLLFLAATKGHIHVLRYLVEKGNIPYTKKDIDKLLLESIEKNQTETSTYLSDTIGKNKFDICENEHFQMAARVGNLDILKYYIEKFKLKDRITYEVLVYGFSLVKGFIHIGQEAIHEALYAGNIPVIYYLIRHHEQLDMLDYKRKTLADIANEKGLKELYLLFKYHPQSLKIMHGRKIENVKNDFVNSKCYDLVEEIYTWPLNMALAHNNAVAKELLVKGADVNGLDDNRNTPLHLALAKKKFDLAELILQKNPDVRLKNNKKEKPIDLALKHGASEQIIAKIKNLEHDLNVKDGFAK